jgi:flagellar protein FlgJ
MGIDAISLYSSFIPNVASSPYRSDAPVQGRYSSQATSPRDTQLWRACQEFEALLLQQLLKAMSSTLTSGGMFGAVAGNSIYQELYETELAGAMAKSGGIGLAEILYRQTVRERSTSS